MPTSNPASQEPLAIEIAGWVADIVDCGGDMTMAMQVAIRRLRADQRMLSILLGGVAQQTLASVFEGLGSQAPEVASTLAANTSLSLPTLDEAVTSMVRSASVGQTVVVGEAGENLTNMPSPQNLQAQAQPVAQQQGLQGATPSVPPQASLAGRSLPPVPEGSSFSMKVVLSADKCTSIMLQRDLYNEFRRMKGSSQTKQFIRLWSQDYEGKSAVGESRSGYVRAKMAQAWREHYLQYGPPVDPPVVSAPVLSSVKTMSNLHH